MNQISLILLFCVLSTTCIKSSIITNSAKRTFKSLFNLGRKQFSNKILEDDYHDIALRQDLASRDAMFAQGARADQELKENIFGYLYSHTKNNNLLKNIKFDMESSFYLTPLLKNETNVKIITENVDNILSAFDAELQNLKLKNSEQKNKKNMQRINNVLDESYKIHTQLKTIQEYNKFNNYIVHHVKTFNNKINSDKLTILLNSDIEILTDETLNYFLQNKDEVMVLLNKLIPNEGSWFGIGKNTLLEDLLKKYNHTEKPQIPINLFNIVDRLKKLKTLLEKNKFDNFFNQNSPLNTKENITSKIMV